MRNFRILLLLLLSIIIGYTSINTSVHAAVPTKIIVHYHRFDNAYSGWGLWLWPYEPDNGEGNTYAFNGDDLFGKYYETDLAGSPFEGSTSIGVIVKTGGWDKDVAIDRHIDITNPDETGTVHVYLVSGDSTIYYDDSAVDVSSRASSVEFSSTTSVEFSTSKAVTEDKVKLYADDLEVDIENFSMLGLTGTFDIVGGADLGKTYKLEIDFEDIGYDPKVYSVGFGGLYTSDDFNAIYAYDGELGAIYSKGSTTFKIWAPISESISLNLYEYGHKANESDYSGQAGTDNPYEIVDLAYTTKGVWEATVTGDLHGVYYTFNVTNGSTTNEVSDPYAFSTGINGRRSMVVDFDRLNPDNWDSVMIPDTIENYNDAIIYEIHVRDLTTHSTWNGTEEYRGKFLGLAETGTTYQGVTTGLDHIIELGVTHVQLLPVFDFGAAVDETKLLDPSYTGVKDTVFNWGYMPENFNSVEGSYSTNPYDGSVKVNEYKQLIQAFHENDIRVIMDVVYNHHGKSADSNFDLIVPGYYFRMTDSGSFSNGSGTGNETASENYMMGKFMVDSVVFWAEEFNITGFRFDLMKLHDVDTMNAIADALHAIDSTILIYGEPWTGGTSPLPSEEAAYFENLADMPGIAVFSDVTRDGIKGSVWNDEDTGFIQGNSLMDENVKLGIVGGVAHTGVFQPMYNIGTDKYWALTPNQTINYVTAHDNNTLFDKIMLSTDELEWEQIQDMQKQANAIILTSNGIPFLHGGVDIMRSKPCTVIEGVNQGECDASSSYDHNSYRSPDSTNQIDWSLKADNIEIFNYYKGLIELRKSIDVFSYDTLEEMNDKMYFFPDASGVISYIIYDEDSPWEYTYVIHNNSTVERNMSLQGMEWNLVVNKDHAGIETLEVLSGDIVTVKKNETLVMYKLAHGAVYIPSIEEELISVLQDSLITDDMDSNLAAITKILEEKITGEFIVTMNTDLVDYNTPGTYQVVIIITDTFENNYPITYNVIVETPENNNNLYVIIGSTIVGVAAIGAGIFFFRKRT